ncbi:MAG TPA: ankyrin repeat domain-containing protein [Blastocatellia bacterium]|nr:ankyrin repeat domain-containing protein [Blastocatellia bacterium]
MKNAIERISVIAVLLALAACAQNQGTERSPENDALLRASRAGHADTVKSLLNSPGVNVNAQDESGSTPLIEAARNGHEDVVEALLIARADVKAKDNQGKTALMYASEGGHTDSVKLLRQAGATQ